MQLSGWSDLQDFAPASRPSSGAADGSALSLPLPRLEFTLTNGPNTFLTRPSVPALGPPTKLALNYTAASEALNGAQWQPKQRQQQQQHEQQRPGHPKGHLRPVLVLVHGDSFDFGAGRTINALPYVQAARQLVVTFNYRLNILGELPDERASSCPAGRPAPTSGALQFQPTHSHTHTRPRPPGKLTLGRKSPHLAGPPGH